MGLEMVNTLFIGIAGYARCGKNSVIEEIYEQAGGRRVNFAFATDLKYRVARSLHLSMETVESMKQILRPLMVELGRTARMLDPDVWIRPVHEAILDEMSDEETAPDIITISDVRYLNEGDFIRRTGGHVFYIHRPGVGPANDEERDSIAELRRVLKPPAIVNVEGAPEKAAAEILAIVKGRAAC